MKANELMIGDWVMDGDMPARVTSITCDGIVETTRRISNIEVIEPIPLTPEIMEKNFPDTEDGVLWWKDVDGMHIETETDGDMMFCGLFHYVHQLQHVLRLCGIEKEIVL